MMSCPMAVTAMSRPSPRRLASAIPPGSNSGTKIGDPTPAHQVGALIVSRLAADLLTPAVRISGILCASGPGSARLGITGCGNVEIGSAAER